MHGTTTSLSRPLLVYCYRASGAAGSSQNSRRATLTAAPDYARRWCTIETHHLRRKHLTSPRREQPRRVLRGCDSPSVILYQIPFCFIPKSVMRNYLIINKNENLSSLREVLEIFIKHLLSNVCSSRPRRSKMSGGGVWLDVWLGAWLNEYLVYELR